MHLCIYLIVLTEFFVYVFLFLSFFGLSHLETFQYMVKSNIIYPWPR